MSMRKMLFGTVILLAMHSTPALAWVDVDIGIAPPAPQVEVVPAARPGYIWAPGYWAWEDGRHVWVAGRWIGERPGYVWYGEHWEHRGDKWHFERGYWARRQ